MKNERSRLTAIRNHWFIRLLNNKLELTPMLLPVVAFILGIVLHGKMLSGFDSITLFFITAVSILCFFIFRRFWCNYRLHGMMVLLSIFFLGAFRISIYEQRQKVVLPKKAVDISVVVADSPKESEYGMLFQGVVVASESGWDGKTIRCTLRECSSLPRVGQTLLLHGEIRPIVNKHRSNFDYELWAKSHGIVGQMYVNRDEAFPTDSKLGQLNAWDRFSIKTKILRGRLLDRFREESRRDEKPFPAYDDNDEGDLIAAMAFGERSGIGQEVRDMFAVTGASHLLALSGMHLGILYALLMFVMVRRKRMLFGQLVLLFTIWTYVVLVGMPLSVLRAAIMLTIFSVSTLINREKMSVNALCLAALIILVFNPVAIWDVGFQLSFMAMVGIFVCFSPIYNIIGVEFLFRHSIIKKIWALICVSVAAQITTMPLSVYYFGRLPLMFLLTNLVTIPLVTVLLYAVFLSMLLLSVPVVKTLMVKITFYIASLLMAAVGMLAGIDFMSINNISINWIQLMLIYIVLAILFVMIVYVKHVRTYDKYRKQMTNRF